MDDVNNPVKKFFEELEAAIIRDRPKREDKVPLTIAQKYMIKHWEQPSATTSAKCGYCGDTYSSGYLKICKADPETFCSIKVTFTESKPKGFTDEELGFYFGITRDELDED
jgi:hypothetical protein